MDDTFAHPLKVFRNFLRGPRTESAMAPELPVLYKARRSEIPPAVKEVRVALEPIGHR